MAKAESDKWLEKLSSLDLTTLTAAAQAEVEAVEAAGTQLDRFHGKKILRAVYGHLQVKDAQLGYAGFVLLLAAHEAAHQRAAKLAEPAVQRIRLFVPAGLPEALRSSGTRPWPSRWQSGASSTTRPGPQTPRSPKDAWSCAARCSRSPEAAGPNSSGGCLCSWPARSARLDRAGAVPAIAQPVKAAVLSLLLFRQAADNKYYVTTSASTVAPMLVECWRPATASAVSLHRRTCCSRP